MFQSNLQNIYTFFLKLDISNAQAKWREDERERREKREKIKKRDEEEEEK